jgi:hypothetical protein
MDRVVQLPEGIAARPSLQEADEMNASESWVSVHTSYAQTIKRNKLSFEHIPNMEAMENQGCQLPHIRSSFG